MTQTNKQTMATPIRTSPIRLGVYWGTVGLVLISILTGCPGRREIKIDGKTMGTTYHITIIGGPFTGVGSLHKGIDERLDAINQSMSTYLPESEISRFNRMEAIGQRVPIGRDFQAVMQIARQLFQLTQGAWDGTLDPLIDLWGFGRSNRPQTQLPAADDIQTRLADVGFDHIRSHPDGSLSKDRPSVSLDLASVAKGYAVDAVAALIGKEGFTDYLVEIGGEVFAAGVRIDGQPWRIGINKPDADAPLDQVYHVVHLKDRAFATSGDYRIFFEIQGRRYSHIIDPRSGYPVSNGVVSVSVTADTCAMADGLATALMVMGVEAGIALVNRMAGVECLVVTRDAQGRLVDHFSAGFQTVK